MVPAPYVFASDGCSLIHSGDYCTVSDFFSLFFFFVFLLVNTVSSSSSRALAHRISGGGITVIAPASAARCFPKRDGRTLLEVRPATILALRTDFPFLCFTVFVFLFLVVICIFITLFGQFPSIRFLSTSGSTRANFLILVIYLNSALVTRFNSNGATAPANVPTKPPFINRAFFFLTVPDFLLSVLSEFAYLDNFHFCVVFSGKFLLRTFFEHCDNVFTNEGSAPAISCLANLGFALANMHNTSACFLRPWGTAVLFRLFALCLEVPHERCMSTAGQSLNECMCQLLVAYNLIKFYLIWALCLCINIYLLDTTSVLTFCWCHNKYAGRAWINNLCRCDTYNPGVLLCGALSVGWWYSKGLVSLCISVHSAPLILLGHGYIITLP